MDRQLVGLAKEIQEKWIGRKATLAVAESCTGGMLGAMLTSVPGSSAYFLGGVIAYTDKVKTGVLGVSAEDLLKYGAVSVAVARQMAEGAARLTGASVAVGITGVAGPDGGTKEKPVGTVFIAVVRGESSRVEKYVFSGNRDEVRRQAAARAMELLLGKAPARIKPDPTE